MRSRAVSGSGHVERIAMTAGLAVGVKPSPTPDPQSFQKPMSGVLANGRRAKAIITIAQDRAAGPRKRNNERQTVCGTLVPLVCCQSILTYLLK